MEQVTEIKEYSFLDAAEKILEAIQKNELSEFFLWFIALYFVVAILSIDSKNPKYREKDFHELVKMKVPSNEAIHTTTINKYLGNLSSFLTWCVNNGYSNTNVFSGMKLPKKNKVSSERDRFTEQELKKIF